jgi:23S rRNA pseudouridine955/2504/2580 synthase
MSVENITVEKEEAGQRLDRWFKRRYPALGHGRLEKLLRTGQIRVDGKRAEAKTRLEAWSSIRVPPLGDLDQPPPPPPPPELSAKDRAMLLDSILVQDAEVLILNKPPGLAVQGGTGLERHLDAMLDALTFDAKERPRLVHRLDKDTSGVLVLGRTPKAAAWLAHAFKSRSARKVYWALVAGLPSPRDGEIDAPLSKLPGSGGEKMGLDAEEGKKAITLFRTVDHAGDKVSWLELEPQTGRTHQLRVHCALLGVPILGDGKYGGAEANVQGSGVSRKMHLHARSIELERPDGKLLTATAPLPEHMKASFKFFGFEEGAAAKKGGPWYP